MRILLVDDDSISREYVTRALQRAGFTYTVDQADTAQLGQELIERNHYDVILLDFYLPGANGMDLLLPLRANESFEGSAVVMMSNSEDEALAEQCLRCGAQDFLLKSEITPKRLYRAITNAQTRQDLEFKLTASLNKTKVLAETDQLTGLANRYLFNQELKKAMLETRRTNHKVVLLFIDLDHFKYINDSFGHNSGDKLLKIVVERIRKVLRGGELFARLGGDEFGIFFRSDNPLVEAGVVAQRIITALDLAIKVNDTDEVIVGASIGVAVHDVETETNDNLLSQADVAMYRAKSLGRNRYCFFETEMQMRSLERLVIENGLRRSILSNEFELHYQPIYITTTGELWGFEALVRWRIEGKLLYPDKFIGIAEETRLIQPIGTWIIDNALKQLAVWREKSGLNLNMAINLSPVQLDDKFLVMRVKKNLAKLGLAAQNVEFEITETALLEKSQMNVDTIKELYRIGCHIALDDFGTGYSSISHLYNFPITTVKLDKSIISGAALNKRSGSLASGLAKMIHMLRIETVAEGVEDRDSHTFCQNIGVTRVQGYFFSKPLSVRDIESQIFNQLLSINKPQALPHS